MYDQAIAYPTQEDVIDLLTNNTPADPGVGDGIPCVHRFLSRRFC
jgi:hypothetical protein